VNFGRAWLTGLVLVTLSLSGCGDDDAEAPPDPGAARVTTNPATPPGDDPATSPACRAVSKRAVERAIREASGRGQRVERKANESLDLSICEFRERTPPDLYVELTIDSAPQAERRYTILIEEGRQRATFDAIPDSSKPIGVRGLGDDDVNGGVGAFWVKLTSQLTVYDQDRLVKVSFHVAGVNNDRSRAAAISLARQILQA
jgi:hypothetical protein